jgi:hypothetical protein
MSHDFWIERPDPDNGLDTMVLSDWRNHTRNTSRMWHWSIEQASGGVVHTIQSTDGWPVDKTHTLFVRAHEVMAANGDKLREWNPPNGWGSYESALEYLAEITEDCRRFRDVPGAIVRWSV